MDSQKQLKKCERAFERLEFIKELQKEYNYKKLSKDEQQETTY